MPLIPRPLILAVLDGWGHSDTTEYNAIHSAHKPVWDDLWALYPHALIGCSGLDVGLPDNQMGNSEVGHMHLGAGRLVLQELTRITRAVEDGSFFRNENLIAPVDRAVRSGRAIHILGLLSPGGVHSHEAHILAMMDLAAKRGATQIYLHAFLDGRDRPPKSAADSILEAQVKIAATGAGRIASLIGRYFAMDRNHDWSRTQEAYDLIAHGRARFRSTDPFIALDMAYARGETDEFVQATAIVPANGDAVTVADGDVVLFMNFRADRARQLTRAFIEPDFDRFERGRTPGARRLCQPDPLSRRFPHSLRLSPGAPAQRLGRISRPPRTHSTAHRRDGKIRPRHLLLQRRRRERVFDGEDRILVPSPKVATYDLKPEMSADARSPTSLVEAIRSEKYDVIVCNFANADMVGHTGELRGRGQGDRDDRRLPRAHRGRDSGRGRGDAHHRRSR